VFHVKLARPIRGFPPSIADRLISTRGVKHGRLVPTTTGRSPD